MTFSGFLFAVLTFMLFAWKDYGFYASDPDHPEFPALPRWTFTVAALFLFLAYTLGKQKYDARCKTDVRLFRWYRWETGETDGEQWTFRGVVRPRSRFFHGRFNSGRSVFTLRTWSQIQYHSIPYVLHIVERFVQFLFIPLGKVQYRCLILALGVRLFNVGHHSSLFTCRGQYDRQQHPFRAKRVIFKVTGHESWQFILPGGITTGLMFEILLYSMALLTNVPVILNNIYVSYQEKTGHMRSFSEAMRPLVPVTAFFLITLSWISLSPSNILERDPRAVFVVISTIFSNICVSIPPPRTDKFTNVIFQCRLIVAQMSNTRCDIFNWLLVPTSIFILLSILIKNAAFELFLTYTLCIFTTCAHIHYGTCVVSIFQPIVKKTSPSILFKVRQMCKHLRINCFSIKKSSD